MVDVFSPYILGNSLLCFPFQVNLTFNDFTGQIMSKVICVPIISLNHFLSKQNYHRVHVVLFLLIEDT